MQYRRCRRPFLPRIGALTALMMLPAAVAGALEFPQTSYAARGWMHTEGRTMHFRQHIDWEQKRMRMVMAPESGSEAMVIVYDMTDGSGFMFTEGDDLPASEKVAIVTAGGDTYEQMRADYDAMGELEPVGSLTVNDEDCTLYRDRNGSMGPGGEEQPGTACITADGIVVQYVPADTDTPTLELTAVERGSQESGLFELPPGYRKLDMSNASFGETLQDSSD